MSPDLILVDLDAEELYQFADAFSELGSTLLLGLQGQHSTKKF